MAAATAAPLWASLGPDNGIGCKVNASITVVNTCHIVMVIKYEISSSKQV
jgi:hypothetical protein